MGKIVSFSTVILGCILLVGAEPPVTSYTINGESNGYEHNSNIINSAYTAGKENYRENTDFYAGRNSGHSSTTGRSQRNLEESLSNSYSTFSPTSHNTDYSEHAGSALDGIVTSPYLMNNPAQSTFESYTSINGNSDSTFESYTQGADQAGSDFNQFHKLKNSPYMRIADNLAGASSATVYSELGNEGSTFKEYTGDSFRGHAQQRGYMEGEQVFYREPSNSFNSPSNEYLYGKPKETIFGMSRGNKFMNDMYPLHSEMRYVSGNHGTMKSPVFLQSSASIPFNNMRGSTGPYSSVKFNKYNKYTSEYTPNSSLNDLSKGQDIDYLYRNYGKDSGKPVPATETRSNSYGSQPYLAGPLYLNKIVGNYKSKPSFVTYSNGSPNGYSSMPRLYSGFSGSSYADSPSLRRYRSSNYVSIQGIKYPDYY